MWSFCSCWSDLSQLVDTGNLDLSQPVRRQGTLRNRHRQSILASQRNQNSDLSTQSTSLNDISQGAKVHRRNRTKLSVITKFANSEIMTQEYTPKKPSLREVYRYNCPLCMRFFNTMLETSCCKNYICHGCASELQRYEETQTGFEVRCPHCNEEELQLEDVDPKAKVKTYSDSPYHPHHSHLSGSVASIEIGRRSDRSNPSGIDDFTLGLYGNGNDLDLSKKSYRISELNTDSPNDHRNNILRVKKNQTPRSKFPHKVDIFSQRQRTFEYQEEEHGEEDHENDPNHSNISGFSQHSEIFRQQKDGQRLRSLLSRKNIPGRASIGRSNLRIDERDKSADRSGDENTFSEFQHIKVGRESQQRPNKHHHFMQKRVSVFRHQSSMKTLRKQNTSHESYGYC